MSMAMDICNYLAATFRDESTAARYNVAGFDCGGDSPGIYLNNIPPNRSDCICVFDTGGYEPLRYHGDSTPLDRPTAQVRIRSRNLAAAREMAERLFAELDNTANMTINGVFYLQLNCTAPPAYLGLTQISTLGQAHEYTLNLYSIKIRG